MKKTLLSCILTASVAITLCLGLVIPVKAEMTEGQQIVYQHQQEVLDYIKEEAYKRADEQNNNWQWQQDQWKWNHYDSVTLKEGDTHHLVRIWGRYWSDNSDVASVNSEGEIKANNKGTCRIYMQTWDNSFFHVTEVKVEEKSSSNNNDRNSYNYYTQPTQTAATANASWNMVAANMILATPQKGTVNLAGQYPLSINSGLINVLAMRPDVKVNIMFGYNGHNFSLYIPAGYNLIRYADATGSVDILALSNVKDGQIKCKLIN